MDAADTFKVVYGVLDFVNGDFYVSSVLLLRGLDVPKPSAVEAALFS